MLDGIVEFRLQDNRIVETRLERLACSGRDLIVQEDLQGTRQSCVGVTSSPAAKYWSQVDGGTGHAIACESHGEVEPIQECAGIHPGVSDLSEYPVGGSQRSSGSPMRPTHCTSGSVTATSASNALAVLATSSKGVFTFER